jgi:hypothetical protein
MDSAILENRGLVLDTKENGGSKVENRERLLVPKLENIGIGQYRLNTEQRDSSSDNKTEGMTQDFIQ